MTRASIFCRLVLIAVVMLFFGFGCGEGPHDEHEGHDHAEPASGEHAEHDEHAEDGEHDEHEEHEEHDEHEEEFIGRVELTEKQRERIRLELAVAAPGTVVVRRSFPGEIILDPDRVAHVAPRISGVVHETPRKLGDRVAAGDTLAILESRELAEAKAAYLAALSRRELAKATFLREESLWKKRRISSEQEYLTAKQGYEEIQIECRVARRQLMALGCAAEELDQLPRQDDAFLTRHEIASPLDGVVVAKHAVLGETVGQGETFFTIADLSFVWVRFNVYQRDLAAVRPGQQARIGLGADGETLMGTVDYVSPIIDEETRTAQARIVLDNADGTLVPGLFVTVNVAVQESEAPVVVPAAAIQVLDETEVVFVEDGDGYAAVHVRLGLADRERVSVTGGLHPGQRYVVRGAFDLKAVIVSRGMDAHAGHGH